MNFYIQKYRKPFVLSFQSRLATWILYESFLLSAYRHFSLHSCETDFFFHRIWKKDSNNSKKVVINDCVVKSQLNHKYFPSFFLVKVTNRISLFPALSVFCHRDLLSPYEKALGSVNPSFLWVKSQIVARWQNINKMKHRKCACNFFSSCRRLINIGVVASSLFHWYRAPMGIYIEELAHLSPPSIMKCKKCLPADELLLAPKFPHEKWIIPLDSSPQSLYFEYLVILI